MINRHRGEIEARLNGERYRLCLTLGALAELEDAFGVDDMVALAQRFETGRLRSTDAIRVITAGLRGAGHDVCEDDVAAMRVAGGVRGYVDIVAELLRATFGSDAGEDEDGRNEAAGSPSEPGAGRAGSMGAAGGGVASGMEVAPGKGPFPGTT